MQNNSALDRAVAWIRDLFTDPAHDPRPNPVTGEAWLVAAVEDRHGPVTHVDSSSRETAKQPVHC
ncbi:hypothetical protein H0B56_22480 [Haloechinothrix sp. YIM 98757]|uniref:Uncharacterized protein n=1 Tax=Haloechinothrix aidingensis TaxID=2752311 RepID=A0A838AGK6_9PSEU|nr:hypothetical protein [Haloechinothrix aidingensis]MBA0128321.1 hypothetical protein [Haloechinothrix aidingensis]